MLAKYRPCRSRLHTHREEQGKIKQGSSQEKKKKRGGGFEILKHISGFNIFFRLNQREFAIERCPLTGCL